MQVLTLQKKHCIYLRDFCVSDPYHKPYIPGQHTSIFKSVPFFLTVLSLLRFSPMFYREGRAKSVQGQDYLLDERGSILDRIGCLLATASRVHQTSYPVGTGVPSSAVRQPRRDANHSPSSPIDIKNAWSYTSIPHTSAWVCA